MRGKGLRVEGRVTGQIEREGAAVVGQKAEVRTKVRMKELLVQGPVEVRSGDRCGTAETVRIVGDVRAQRLAVAEQNPDATWSRSGGAPS